MSKEVIKQIIITVLTCIAIVLLLMLVLYQYVPSNKIMPSKVEEYKVPENIKAEMEKTESEELANTEEMYEITDAELDKQKSRQSYNPGKSDPFSDYTTGQTNDISEKNPKSGTGTNETNSTNNYYQANNIVGTK